MMNELFPAKRFLWEHFPAGGRMLCAVSGGLDSMCLLELLDTWGRMRDFVPVAAHFNHRLRGAEADRDEAFVQAYCAKRNIPFVAGRGDTRALAASEGLSLEEAARKLRYAFLEETADRERCDAILTAHHAGDNAETVLLNLIRGTGSAGLAGIPQVRGRICRPLLQIPHETLAAYAAEKGIPHVEDATNADPAAASRNALRHKVLPVLKELNPRAVENIGRAAGILTKENEVLETLAAQLADQTQKSGGGLTISCRALREAPEAVAERAVLLLIARAAGHRKDITAAHVVSVLEAVRKDQGMIDLPYGLVARKGDDTLTLAPRAAAPELLTVTVGDDVSFGEVSLAVTDTPDRGGSPMYLPEGAELTVTTWRPTDHLLLPGSRGRRSFKRLCADRGISPELRDAVPILRVNGAPAASGPFGIHADFAPRPEGRTVYVTFYMRIEESNI